MRSNRPARSRPSARAADRARLSAWLAEYALDRAARAAAGTTPSAPAGSVPLPFGAVRREHRPLTVGDIRLLPPGQTPGRERPLLVAVLRIAAPRALAAPFGPYAVPATPDEWRTRLEPVALRVLCVWNARWFEAVQLARGWRVGRLPAADLRAAERIFQGLEIPAARPPDLRRRIGPPLIDPRDPRHAYRRAETADLDVAAAAVSEALSGYPEAADDDAEALPRAAEKRDGYGSRRALRRGSK